MRSDGGLSSLLTSVLVPLCVWGLLCSLLMHLIDLRSVFVSGGEWRLRQATLAFAAGVVLIQRLAYSQGKTQATTYTWALGAAIALFALWHSAAHVSNVPWFAVAPVTLALYAVLFYVGTRITSACAVDDEQAAAAAQAGALGRRRVRAERKDRGVEILKAADSYEERVRAAMIRRARTSEQPDDNAWSEKLPTEHPARIIFLFTLVAIPIFALGLYLFDPPPDPRRLRLGLMLFIHLWCAMALLALASLSQLRAYFNKRGVSLPEMLGLSWLGVALALVSVVVLLAFFLPQPPTAASAAVRESVQANYKGWQQRWGMRETGGTNPGTRGRGDAGGNEEPTGRESPAPDTGQPLPDSEGGAPAAAPNQQAMEEIDAGSVYDNAELDEITLAMKGVFKLFMAAVAVVLLVVGAVIVYALVTGAGRELLGSLRQLARDRRLQRKVEPGRRRRRGELTRGAGGRNRFAEVGDPFGAGELTGDELVRRLWAAMLAMCADRGDVCPPECTPLEFVAREPESLRGFEDQARYLAELFSFSEFSGRPVGDAERPRLREFWEALRAHAAGG